MSFVRFSFFVGDTQKDGMTSGGRSIIHGINLRPAALGDGMDTSGVGAGPPLEICDFFSDSEYL